MAVALSKPHFKPLPAPSGAISPRESAQYTSDLLESLRKMAAGQGQHVLAHLLELARFEARSLVSDAGPGPP
jgi:hypothetical protein